MRRLHKQTDEDQAQNPEDESPREEFTRMLRGIAHKALLQMVEEEVAQLCGKRHEQGVEREYYRAGNAPSYVHMESRRESVIRPRVRRTEADDSSSEVELESWKLAQSAEEFEGAVQAAVLAGVSTRRVGDLQPGQSHGNGRSTVSKLWQKRAAELVEELQHSDLGQFDLLVLMLDAVVLGDGLVATVALGIDTEGRKQVLGFRVGSSENAEVTKDLLRGLMNRGLRLEGKAGNRRLLAVLDGSKALKNALLEVAPRTLIQRCLVHKERNIRGYLGKQHWGRLGQLFNRLRKAQGPEDGKQALGAIEAFLSDKNAQARESLQEAEGELLAVHGLNVPNTLHRALLSTNGIENAFKNLRRHIGRVSRWRDDTRQADMWLASGLTLAQRGFRRVNGHTELGKLMQALTAG